MTTINTVFPSRMWAVRAGGERWIEGSDMDWCIGAMPSHEIVDFRDRHTGWYTCEDPSKDDLYVGVAISLRGKRGHLAAYQEKCNDGYLVDFGTLYTTAEEAAYAGDQLAERHAEKEREYQAAWRQGNDAAQLRDEANEIRDNLLHLMSVLQHARRALRQHVGRDAGDGITTIMCELVKERLGDINRLRRKRDRLLDVYAPLQDAVNEGYGR